MMADNQNTTGKQKTCTDCGLKLELGVHRSPAGYYGIYCNCGPYSRESIDYPDEAMAKLAFEKGNWIPRTDLDPEMDN